MTLFEYGKYEVVDGGLLGNARHPLLLIRYPNGYLSGAYAHAHGVRGVAQA